MRGRKMGQSAEMVPEVFFLCIDIVVSLLTVIINEVVLLTFLSSAVKAGFTVTLLEHKPCLWRHENGTDNTANTEYDSELVSLED